MLADLPTESEHPDSKGIDLLPTRAVIGLIHALDATIANSVERELDSVSMAVDLIAGRLARGGRLFYVGAGTSGRLGVLDASECPPTFHSPPEMVQGIIAGGDRALRFAVERAEDSPEQGEADLQERRLAAGDAVVGIAASGRTPYVLGALAFARRTGALAIGLSCVRDSLVSKTSDIAISPEVGPEVLTGSTRMRAGTATKMVLNMISTGVMIRLGYVYGNLMVKVQPTNSKLEDRAKRIICRIAEVDEATAGRLLAEGGSVTTAIVMSRLGLARSEAESRLAAAGGNLRIALGEAPAR